MTLTLVLGLGLVGLTYLLGSRVAHRHNQRLERQQLARKLYEHERSARWLP